MSDRRLRAPRAPPSPVAVAAMTVHEALAGGGVAPLDASLLLAHVLGVDRAFVIAHGEQTLTQPQAKAYFGLARRRRDGEPIAYLVGRREFWGLELTVNAAVLVPRPETETLVETALANLDPQASVRVLDIGTGSGAIAIAIARERPHACVLATDVSRPALDIARENARRLRARNIAFRRADVFDGLRGVARGFAPPYDLIVSNPPYVASSDPHLGEPGVRFEPAQALVAGADGLDVLRRLIAQAPPFLAASGVLAVEHGYDQAQQVRALFEAASLRDVASARDLSGIERVVVGRKG